MKKKNYLLSMLTIMMVALGSFCLVSCGDDDEENNENGGSEQTDPWLSGTVRGEMMYVDVPIYVGGEHTGHYETTKQFLGMDVIVFSKDHTASYYTMEMESANGDNPSLSSFNGYSWWVYNNQHYPKKYTYSLDKETLCVTLFKEDGVISERLYPNFNPSKTSWSELRNESGRLRYIIWNPNVPVDNSRFEETNN